MTNPAASPKGAADAPCPVAADQPETDRARLFLRLFLQNHRRIYAYILTLLPHRADAEDVLQDVSFVLWEKFNPDDPPRDFAAWGCRIAYFKVLDLFKKNRRCHVRFSQEMLERIAETAVEQADALQLDERREALAGCLEKLSAKDRDLLQRRLADGASTESTAAALGRSTDAVYKALARIRHTLFDCVTRSLAQQRSV